MRNLLKLSAFGLCALSLSGCAFTQDVVQNAYDDKAEKSCSTQYGGEAHSIHRTANSNCSNGTSVSKDTSKYKDASKYEPRKPE